MRVIQLRISGPWAHFRKPETNNNPLTHDFITKTALIGLMGAVLGRERQAWNPLIPVLSTDLIYGVQIENIVKKESWGFTLREAIHPASPLSDQIKKSPRPFEFLRNPQFRVMIGLQKERSTEIFDEFSRFVQNEMACYTPTLGLQPCVAHLAWIGEAKAEAQEGEFSTLGFVRRDQLAKQDITQTGFRLGFEKIPTAQTADWWNKLEWYREVAYPANGLMAKANGPHFRLSNGEEWCLL